MLSSISMKSFRDLGKRKSRTIFTVLTIALAVGALGMFGVVPLFDDAMEDEIERSNMWNINGKMPAVDLNESDIEHINELENVENIEVRQQFFTRIYIGERRADALFIGVRDFREQTVDIIEKQEGEYPGWMEVMTDSGNLQNGVYDKGIGEDVRVINSSGDTIALNITSIGRTLPYDQSNWGVAVFFTDMNTLQELSGLVGFNILSLDLKDTDEVSAERTISEVGSYLENNTGFIAFSNIPQIRTNGDWPGKEDFSDTASFFYALTFMTLFCSLFLISNTMHTIITEQIKEISQLKAIGATKPQILRSYLTTSSIMGAMGSMIGVVIGMFLTYGMVWFLGTSFYNITPGFSLHLPTVTISLFAGIFVTLIASVPALIQALRTPVREGMEGSGISSKFGGSFIDKLLMRSSWLPRSAQMGLRNASRKKGRSGSTLLQIALAVGMFLAVISIGHSLSVRVAEEYDNFTYDILTTGQMEGGKPLTEENQYFIRDIEGVETVEPLVISQGKLGESAMFLFGYRWDQKLYKVDSTMYRGRWFTELEESSASNVVVIGKALAGIEGVDVGDNIELVTSTGVHFFEVIGINSGQMMNGRTGFLPLETAQEILKIGDVVTGFGIKTVSDDHGLIDTTANEIQDGLMTNGYVVDNEIWYVMKENNIRSNQNLVNLMMATGSIIVFITTIGLMSTLTMNVLERTKEIGMLRCIGSRAGHIRRVFASEGLVLAMAGGILGIPIGYGVGLFLNLIMLKILNLEMELLYPMKFILITLSITLVLTLVVIQMPLRRAVRFRPGDALRYQ